MATTPNLLQLQNGKKSFGARILFDQATFAVNQGEHVGVIGPNGAGKTTLFNLLIHSENLDSGQLIRSKELSMGYLSQHDHWEPNETGNSYLEKTSKLPLWQVKSMGRDLQVSEEIFEKPILSLSGGYRMRIKLMSLLGQDPNLMLLDEPTNYLDLETTLLLEKFLQNYEGAFLLISHDREFLRRTTDHILEVEAGDITKYNGNIDDYFEQKELLRSQLQAQAQSQADKKKTILEFVSRFGAKATKAKQAQSRLKTLEKMEMIELKPIPIAATIRIPEPPHVGKSVIKLDEAAFGYPKKQVLNNVTIDITRGDHVAVVGLNGAGKSTLLKGLAGTLNPLKGKREVGYQVSIAIFNQHVIEILNPNHTVIQSLEDTAPRDVSRQEILDMAGSLLFSGDQFSKKIHVLSGGEKSRVALGRILLQKSPCLLLDEPTNHLDFQTVEALTQSLKQYKGTLIVVSHDRSFIRRVGTKILEVTNGNVVYYPGTYDEYVWRLQKNLASGKIQSSELESEPQQDNKKNTVKNISVSNKKEYEKTLRILNKEILECESSLQTLEEANIKANENIVSGSKDSKSLVLEMASNTKKIEQIESLWLELVTKRDSLNS